jgi:hypothetical protein
LILQQSKEYDPTSNTIGFACLRTTFHPPELADPCGVASLPR